MRVSLKNRSLTSLQTHTISALAGVAVGWVACLVLGGGRSSLDLSLLYDAGGSSLGPTSSSSSQLVVPAAAAHQRTWNDKSTGWSLAHIFYGTTDHLPILAKAGNTALQCHTWFSQARQDQLIYELLNRKRGGYFVDLAANDAMYISNTFSLEHFFGWKGLCIEANPAYWPVLSYRKCDLVGAVVSVDREEVQFRFSGMEMGGIVGDQFDNKKGASPEQPRLTVTLMEVLQRFDSPKTIDYFSLDVEGAEDLVLQPTVLDTYQFNLITIERPSEQLKKLLESKGYRNLKVLTNFGDTLFSRNAYESQLNMTALTAVDTWNSIINEIKEC